MSSLYRDNVKEVVRDHVCVKLTCDCCGRDAHDPVPSIPVWDEDRSPATQTAALYSTFSCDGDWDKDEIDLCPKCADWLMDLIRCKSLRRRLHGDGS